MNERNIDNSHDERFFFEAGPPQFADLAAGVSKQWSQLIENYQKVHERELSRGATRPPALDPNSRFSRRISHKLRSVALAERDLNHGALCYAVVRTIGTTPQDEALYPVMI